MLFRSAGGFSCVLGNPPWERIKNKPQAEGEGRFLRASGRYPLTAHGDVNAYAVFAEAGRGLTGPHGRLGLIVPTGIATDLGPQPFFRDLVDQGALASLLDFGNGGLLFPDVHRSYKFSLLTLTGRATREPRAEFAFFLRDVSDLDDPARRFTLTPAEIIRLNPHTGTCPVFRTPAATGQLPALLAILPAVRNRPGRRRLHHGHVHRRAPGRPRPARPVPDQGGHPGLLRPDGPGPVPEIPDRDHAPAGTGTAARTGATGSRPLIVVP